MRIAIVGSGISGLVAAHTLAPRHHVVVFEAEDRLGGHTHTVDAGQTAIDTGFIVFNTRTYPHFVRFLEALGVGWQHSDMSFSVRSDRRNFEYGSASLNALFAQRRHLLSPRFHRLWRDILRFYRDARELLAPGVELTLGEYLSAHGYSDAFITDHLLPLVGAVWSSNRADARDFPARLLVRFFDQHGFLQRGGGWPWLTIKGGSREYIRAWQKTFRGEIRLTCPVDRISRGAGVTVVSCAGRAPESFDHVIVACHADQALGLVSNPTPRERELLAAFPFQRNDVVLHTDERLMPKHRRTWSSWNYHLDDEQAEGPSVTYWMNRLQRIPFDSADPAQGRATEYFVTLNRTADIRPERILRRFSYAHPRLTPAATRAQARHAELIDHDGVSYCGAYWRNGFHEDGVVSAIRVCEALGAHQASAPDSHARESVA